MSSPDLEGAAPDPGGAYGPRRRQPEQPEPVPGTVSDARGDTLVLPARTSALVERLCGLGQAVDRLDVADADHDTVAGRADADVTTWITARFADEPAVDDC